ncbi:repressor protein [candidate division WOR_3 bacterium SM23_60]|uniref:Repressor protein n=1 Tax=candidate division WOR_3 bacterium SM23_60 TaxID=1703780 RepID=A0A0S8GMT5_UNCW3|nr:MAG: repressor protein [candidate division WOR_3 bacterium SM23_60]
MAQLGQKIRELRAQNEISQEQLAKALKVSRSAISQIENGERKVCAEELIRLSEIFGMSVDSLLDLEKEPVVVLQKYKKKRQRKSDVRISVPQKNLRKFKEVLLYILNKVGSKPNIGETVIYKLLYFIDFDFYEKYEEQLIGATYKKNHYGPTPVEFEEIMKRMLKEKEIEKVQSKYFQYPQRKYLPLKKADLSHLKAHEIELIDDVLNRLSDMNASDISNYSHNDIPWVTTEDGGVIEYEAVFYRTTPYSVRQYEEDVQRN